MGSRRALESVGMIVYTVVLTLPNVRRLSIRILYQRFRQLLMNPYGLS